MGLARPFRLTEKSLRQAAFSVEQIAAGGPERPDCGAVDAPSVERALRTLARLQHRADRRQRALRSAYSAAPSPHLFDRIKRLKHLMEETAASALVFLGATEYALEYRLRAAAIEVDFSFGNGDGHVGREDVLHARRHYARVRGPVGWNRLLLTDELERRLFPTQTLSSTLGYRLLPSDWLVGEPNPIGRLRRVTRFLDDAALARTYADVAARWATRSPGPPSGSSMDVYRRALTLLGSEIQRRDSIRPTLTDIARIGCEDPIIRSVLSTPIEMSRRLSPTALLDPYLSAEAG